MQPENFDVGELRDLMLALVPADCTSNSSLASDMALLDLQPGIAGVMTLHGILLALS